jgi:hypothetical protein
MECESRAKHEAEMYEALNSAIDPRTQGSRDEFHAIVGEQDLIPFTGTHPAIMRDWLKKRERKPCSI